MDGSKLTVSSDPIGWRKWRQLAKMAEIAPELPKWQHQQMLCRKKLFFHYFFRLQTPI